MLNLLDIEYICKVVMSRIGRQPIAIPQGVDINCAKAEVVVSGPKGKLRQSCLSHVSCALKDDQCLVTRRDDSRQGRSQHGLMRSLIANMVTGVTQGFEKRLEVRGIGYKARIEQDTLVLNIGFSHEVHWSIPQDLEVSVKDRVISVSGISKQSVGQAAAAIRLLKKPEPYKGKGIRYQGEVVRRKSGKGSKEA